MTNTTAAVRSAEADTPIRKPFRTDRMRLASHVNGEPIHLCIPDRVPVASDPKRTMPLTLEEVRNNASVYLKECAASHYVQAIPGQQIFVVNNSNTLWGWWLVRMAVGSNAMGLRQIEIIPLMEKQTGASLEAAKPDVGFYVKFDMLNGWCVANGWIGENKFTGLSSRDEAERMAQTENANMPREQMERLREQRAEREAKK